MTEEQAGKRQPPKAIKGVKFDWLEEGRMCQQCFRLVLGGQLVIRRNARGKAFEHILPLKHGVCLNCGADALSEMAITEYEKVLGQINNYETLRDKQELTKIEEFHMNQLEKYIENLQEFVDELSDFVAYTEKSSVAYYDDEIEVDDVEE